MNIWRVPPNHGMAREDNVRGDRHEIGGHTGPRERLGQGSEAGMEGRFELVYGRHGPDRTI